MLSYNSVVCPMQCIIFWQAKHQAKHHPLEWSVKAAAVHIWCSSLTVNSPLHHPCTPTLRHSQFPVFKHTANVYKRRKTNCKLYLTLSKRFLLHQTGPDAPWACCAMTYRLIPYSQVLVILHSPRQKTIAGRTNIGIFDCILHTRHEAGYASAQKCIPSLEAGRILNYRPRFPRSVQMCE